MNARDKLTNIYGPSSEDLRTDLDAYRDEVLAEADLLPKADVVAWLTKKAREDTPVYLLASKADRGAIRPDNLRMLPAKFFEIGRTYTRGRWTFQCFAIAPSPVDGETWAIGLLSRDGWPTGGGVAVRDATDWDHGGWTDVTEGGQTATPKHYDKLPDPLDGCHWCACGNRWPCKDAPAVTS